MAAGGKMAEIRDVIELKSDDYRVLTSHLLGDDGKWHGFLTANDRRRKPLTRSGAKRGVFRGPARSRPRRGGHPSRMRRTGGNGR